MNTKFYCSLRLYSDVDVYCGEDSGVVRTHRLYLAAMSPFLREVLLSDDCAHEDFSLLLPEVSSGEFVFIAMCYTLLLISSSF